ncbi:MAG: hydrogenase maturation nickel metallochaperone HypA [Actinobacteria bacterium]|nr:hydrogenase maturation nickel metallochaperone HypA [Actinomycetota bacterium]
MHELGITQGIIDRARTAAGEAGAVRIRRLYVTMTPAADFTQESIEMYFEMLAGEDGLFQGAELAFQWGPAAATCLACSRSFEADRSGAVCPECGGTQLRFAAESPMIQLTGLEVVEPGDDEDPDATR